MWRQVFKNFNRTWNQPLENWLNCNFQNALFSLSHFLFFLLIGNNNIRGWWKKLHRFHTTKKLVTAINLILNVCKKIALKCFNLVILLSFCRKPGNQEKIITKLLHQIRMGEKDNALITCFFEVQWIQMIGWLFNRWVHKSETHIQHVVKCCFWLNTLKKKFKKVRLRYKKNCVLHSA